MSLEECGGASRVIVVDVTDNNSDSHLRDLLRKKYREARHGEILIRCSNWRLNQSGLRTCRAIQDVWDFIYFGPPMGIGYYDVSVESPLVLVSMR